MLNYLKLKNLKEQRIHLDIERDLERQVKQHYKKEQKRMEEKKEELGRGCINPPCSHPGLCFPEVCQCASKAGRCSHLCACIDYCELQNKGCFGCNSSCTSKCSCKRDMLECMPNICECAHFLSDINFIDTLRKKPRSRYYSWFSSAVQRVLKRTIRRQPSECKTNLYCQRVNIQLGLKPNLAISSSMNPRAGTGLFALQEFSKHQFIGVYLGQIINEDECEKRAILSEVEGRVYTFDIEYDLLVDALNIGNIIRYANSDQELNNAECKLVLLGERRYNIIQATRHIYPFQEICFPYGAGFTIDGVEHDQNQAKNKKKKGIRRVI